MSGPVSAKPEDFGEGGGVPWDRDLRIKRARTIVGQYKAGGLVAVPWNTPSVEGAPVAPGLELTFVGVDGVEYNPQFYSAGKAGTLVPSMDGEKPSDEGEYLIAHPEFDGEAKLNKSCNLALLVVETINAGFPANRIQANYKEIFEDLFGFWVAKKVTPVSGGKEKSISVPQTVELAEDRPKTKVKDEEADEEATERTLKKLVKVVKSELEDKKSISRADLSTTVMSDYDDDEDAKLMAKLVYDKSFKKALGKKGFELEGETIKKEEED